jgi:hypothetical protein
MKKVREQTVRNDLLTVRAELVWLQDWTDIKGAIKRPTVGTEIAMDDKGCHGSAVVTCSNRVVIAQAVGIINQQSPSQHIMIGKR